MQKIVILEDDNILSQELKELLENNGYQAMVLTNFENLVPSILKINADMILLDINLPNANGEFILKEIRKKSNIPIIMVTSRDNDADEVRSMTLGADDYITKPYHPTILLLRIEAIFKRIHKENEKTVYKEVEIDRNRSLIKRKDKQVKMKFFQNLKLTKIKKNSRIMLGDYK